MTLVRVACLDCRRSFPIQFEEKVFTCPRCGKRRRILDNGARLEWTTDSGMEQFHAQPIHPMSELLAASSYPGYQKGIGAARSRKMLRGQLCKRKPRGLMPALLGFLFFCSYLGWYFFNPLTEAASADISISTDNSLITSILEPSTSPTPGNTPTPSPTPPLMPTPLPPSLLQATTWQSTLDAAADYSHLQETANAVRFQATQTAISIRFTALANDRQATATQKAETKGNP